MSHAVAEAVKPTCAWDDDQPWVHFQKIDDEDEDGGHEISLIEFHCTMCRLELSLHVCHVEPSQLATDRIGQAWSWFQATHLQCNQ